MDTDGERRAAVRRQVPARAFVLPIQAPEISKLIPSRWPYLVQCLLAAISIAVITARQLPERPVLLALGIAVLGSLCIGPVSRLIDERDFVVRLAGASAVVMIPLFLFGHGMTMWAVSGVIAWDVALAALLCVGGVAAAYLRRQPALIFASQLAIWSAAVLAETSLAGVLALVVALAVAIQVSRDQMDEQRREEDRRQARERVQWRARDILADYEQARQGWFWETDRRAQLTYLSVPVAEAMGVEPEKLIGQRLLDLFDLQDTGPEGERTLLFHLSSRSAFSELPVRAAIAGEDRWWSVTGRPIFDDFDNFVGFRGSGTDLTETRRTQQHTSRLAHYDSLTGLANRFQMAQTLEKVLDSPQAVNRSCAVMLLDLDRFKLVNDTLGHPAGDALLQQVAGRLEGAVKSEGQVGRLGGDEFQVILAGRVDRELLGELAQNIINLISQPYSIEGKRVVIGASIGVALSPDDGTTCERLIRNADLALYAAKDGGRGRYHFYADDLQAESEARAQLEADLRAAVANGELQLFYQPVVSVATEKITGFEALLRWQHPSLGWIPPEKFVAIAEESGLIGPIGEWALRTACHSLATWPEHIRCALNVSPMQFANAQLPALITNAVARAGIDPARLELEITEGVFLNGDEGTEAMFAALKGIGVRLALDDFGTGYSSLGYLRKAPFDKIKIDRSFVRGATHPDSRNGAIIASITSLAHALGMETTAEGVETLDELELVRMYGCSHVQGFIYERPLDAEAAAERLETGLASVARGPRALRSPRQAVLRKVVLDHEGMRYNGNIRNISSTGALIEGLWNVPVGTVFTVLLSKTKSVAATTKWCEEDRLGVEFAQKLPRDASGRIVAIGGAAPTPVAPTPLREAG